MSGNTGCFSSCHTLRLRERMPQPSDSGLEPALADPRPDPAMMAETRQRARQLQVALDQLPAKQRESLMLFHAEGLSYRAIASRLGVPIGTVCTWVSRARQSVAGALAETER